MADRFGFFVTPRFASRAGLVIAWAALAGPVFAADLSLTLSARPAPAVVGNHVKIAATVTNAGPDGAGGGSVAFTLPAELRFLSANAGCASAANTVTCSLDALAPGASAVKSIIVTPLRAGFSAVSANVTAAADGNRANNQASAAFDIVSGAPIPSVLQAKGIDRIVTVEHYRFGYNFILILEYDPYVLFTDGTVFKGFQESIEDLDVAASKGREPKKWGTWTQAGAEYIFRFPGEKDERTDKVHPTFAAEPGEPMDGTWRSVGGFDLVFVENRLIFSPDGRFTATNIGGITPSPWPIRPSASSLEGTYLLAGNTLELHHDDGIVTRRGFYYMDAGGVIDRRGLGYSTLSYSQLNKEDQYQTDLTVTSSASPNPAGVGRNLTYSATVANGGPGSARNIKLVFNLPGGVQFVSADMGCVHSGITVTCSLGTVISGTSAIANIVVNPTLKGILAAAAIVTTTDKDTNSANNQVEFAVEVGDAPPSGGTPPVASVVPLVSGKLGNPIRLDATASRANSGGRKVRYQWNYVSGPARPLIRRAHSAKPVIFAPAPGQYVFAVQVSNGAGASDPVQVTVDVPASLRVTQPAGGAVWRLGETVAVGWEATAINPARGLSIALSTDGGASWQVIKRNVGAGRGNLSLRLKANAKTRKWVTSQALLRVCLPRTSRNLEYCSAASGGFAITE